MMVAEDYCNYEHCDDCFERLDEFRKSEQTCDIRLMVSNKEIYAHKIVLASVSEYFKNAIYGLLLNNSGKNELELTDVQYEILSELVNYMYSGEIEINSDNVYKIYNAADYYLIDFLKEKCLDFLEKNLDTDNCVKVWVIANNCKNENLTTEATNFIFANLEIAANTKEFLNLSNEEVNNIFKLWPKDELFDPIISAVLKWAANKDNCDETVIILLKEITHSDISNYYLDNCLSKNEFLQNSINCNKWLVSIYKEKLKLHKSKKLDKNLISENEKFISFLSDQPIIFMTGNNQTTKFYKYDCSDSAIKLYKVKDMNAHPNVCNIYKNWIYVLGNKFCERFRYDDIFRNGHESAFQHDHGARMCSTVLNNSMYIFGDASSDIEGTRIDLNTKQATRYPLSRSGFNRGIAVSDGVIYITGGIYTDIVERFDPREGKTTSIGYVGFADTATSTKSLAALSNQIYCTNGLEYKMTDVRNCNIWVDIGSPYQDSRCRCLTASYGQLYANADKELYKYNKEIHKWESISIFPDSVLVRSAASF